MKPLSVFFMANARLGISPHKANVVKHVKVDAPSQSGRQLLPLLKLPSTLRNEGNYPALPLLESMTLFPPTELDEWRNGWVEKWVVVLS